MKIELIKSSLGEDTCFDSAPFQKHFDQLVEGFNDEMEALVDFYFINHLVSTNSKTEKRKTKEVHLGPNSELGESSGVKIETVTPLPAIEIQSTKCMMETNSPGEEKIESQT